LKTHPGIFEFRPKFADFAAEAGKEQGAGRIPANSYGNGHLVRFSEGFKKITGD
jgi:hypothetical protein